MNQIKTILIGTSEFAKNTFEKSWIDNQLSNFKIIKVVTTPDKPVGRKQKLTPSPVKKWAIEKELEIFQPQKISDPDSIEKIKKLNPDLIILCAYGQIIPKEILDIPKLGALNVHPSLLPKYRGPSPIQATILNGDKITGVSLMIMDEKMDHGSIISNFKFQISNSKFTYEELSKKLSEIAANLLIKTLPNYIRGKIKPKPQDHSQATFCKIIKKSDGQINWDNSARQIERKIRAYHQWPNAYTFWNNKKLKILNADILDKNTNHKTGEVFLENNSLCVQTGDNILSLNKLQLEGKKPMKIKDFLNGHKNIINAILK